MQVSKWGNSLAIRLPAALVDALDLKEGDDIEVVVAGDRNFEVRRDPKREDAIKKLTELSRPLPKGFVFSRDDANER